MLKEQVHVKVSFQTSDELLGRLVETAERKTLENLKDFGGRQVLIEGGGYEKIWLETQPMGGEMYAKRNMEAGLNNQLLFMELIREDGRMPGSIALIDGEIVPQYNKFQGFCFPTPALNMYFLSGKDRGYLDLLYDTLERFDAYLWRVRDSDGDGCLESWCKYDTGEDHALRYADAPDAWEGETPPENCSVVPMASVDIMSFSYSARETLGKIAALLGKEDLREKWFVRAESVKAGIASYLWDDEKGICLDRDRHHRRLLTLTHNSLRAMYWNSLSPYMAGRFVEEHILNPAEFWTPMPLPSVAVNDPLFRNISTNNWSGQAEALTYQRAIRAMENYGYDRLLPILGNKLFDAIGESCIFVQQYDPFTMEPSRVSLEGEQDGYGPALLSVLEYTSRMYGVHIEGEELYWGGVSDRACVYSQEWGDRVFRIETSEKGSRAYVNGKPVFEAGENLKVITDLQGKVKQVRPYRQDADVRNIRIL